MVEGPSRWPNVHAVGLAVAVGLLFSFSISGIAERQGADLKSWQASFARPDFVPHPSDNPPTPERIALGERLFHDARLSVDGTISCASCHDPRLAFTDGEPTGRGVTGRPLKRHTPALWNLAWAPVLLWDGRADSLEQQVKIPIEHPDEMGETLGHIAGRLAADAGYVRAFAEAFPDDARVTPGNMVKAIAAFQRTIVSPPTRFDRWIAGDHDALSDEERAGFDIFTGRGQCVACHSGFAFTDYSFHDIGLPTEDLGRGPILGVPQINHAFKTPSLRELAWTAPYMHNGSLATLEDVIRHYESGGIDRPSRSKDMPSGLDLSDGERLALMAFLGTLSSERAPAPSREPWVLAGGVPPPIPSAGAAAAATTTVSQRDRQFTPAHVAIEAGQSLTILNDDTRTHNVRIYDPRFDFNSGAQEPGESISLTLPASGTYRAFCGIHPTMRLVVDIE